MRLHFAGVPHLFAAPILLNPCVKLNLMTLQKVLDLSVISMYPVDRLHHCQASASENTVKQCMSTCSAIDDFSMHSVNQLLLLQFKKATIWTLQHRPQLPS